MLPELLNEFDKEFIDEESSLYYDSEGGYAEGNFNPEAFKAFIQRAYELGKEEEVKEIHKHLREGGLYSSVQVEEILKEERLRIQKVLEGMKKDDNSKPSQPYEHGENVGYNEALDEAIKTINK